MLLIGVGVPIGKCCSRVTIVMVELDNYFQKGIQSTARSQDSRCRKPIVFLASFVSLNSHGTREEENNH